jgi:hypothetical protein
MSHEPKPARVKPPLRLVPKLLDLELAAQYCSVSEDTVLRLINGGHVSVVKLPASRSAHRDTSRALLVDREELDQEIAKWKQKRGA